MKHTELRFKTSMVRIYLIPCLFLLASTAVDAAEPIPLTEPEFRMYRQYLNAKADPRVQKMKAEKQNSAIAKDAGFKLKEMEAAILRGEAAGDISKKCEVSLKEALDQTDLKGRVVRVQVDASDPHAVAYLQWTPMDPEMLAEEASLVAAVSSRNCPIVSSLQVWAAPSLDSKERLFQGLISRTAASRIDLARVKEFADTRYVRLFEKPTAQVDASVQQ